MTTVEVRFSEKTIIASWFGLGLWCLTSLSTIFQLYCSGRGFIGGGNRNTGENHRHVASHLQALSHNGVSSTPRHERGSNSQL